MCCDHSYLPPYRPPIARRAFTIGTEKMPKYTATHQRLSVRAAVQMAAYATLETSVKQHINEMIDDLRKECQKNQIATNGVMSALYATQKQHIKELRELSETLTTYKEAHTRICESIAVRAVRTMPAESTSHYGNTAGAATTDSANEHVRIVAHNQKIALAQKPEYIEHYGVRYDVENFSVYYKGTEVGTDFKYLVGKLTAQMHASVREHNFKVTRNEFPLDVWDHELSWDQMYDCNIPKAGMSEVMIIGNIPEVCYMYKSIGYKVPEVNLSAPPLVQSDSDCDSDVATSDVSSSYLSDTATVRAHWTAIYNNVVDSDED